MSAMRELSDLLKAPDASLAAKDDFFAINELYMEKGWGDGLPLIPPTEARVAAMLEYCDRPWNEAVGKIAPRYGEATPLRLAANAVMAGCKPEYFPLIVLAVEALCDEAFNLYGIQATTHMCAPLVIVNGPMARELGMNSGHNAFGPGRVTAFANAAQLTAWWGRDTLGFMQKGRLKFLYPRGNESMVDRLSSRGYSATYAKRVFQISIPSDA